MAVVTGKTPAGDQVRIQVSRRNHRATITLAGGVVGEVRLTSTAAADLIGLIYDASHPPGYGSTEG